MAKDLKKRGNDLDIVQLKNMKIAELTELARELKINGFG